MLFRSIFTILFTFLIYSSSLFCQDTKANEFENLEICHEYYAQAVAVFSRDFDSTILILNTAVPCFKKFEDWENYIKCLNGINSVYFYQENLEKYKTASFFTFKEAQNYLSVENPQYANALNNLNSYYYKIGDFEKALELVTKSLNIKEQNKEPKLELAISYQNIGNIHRLKGDNNKALQFMSKALEYTLDSLEESNHRVAEIYDGLALIYQQAEQVDSAIFYHNKSLSILEKLFRNQKDRTYNLIIESLHGISYLWLSKGNLVKAEVHIQQALKLQKEDGDYRKSNSYELLSKLYFKRNEFKKSLAALKKAEEISSNYDLKNKATLIAPRYHQFAELYIALEDDDQALTYYQNALKILNPGFDSNLFEDNPVENQLLDKPNALLILDAKAKLLYKLFKKSKRHDYLLASYLTYQSATELIRNIRQGILTVESKNTLSKKIIPVYEGAIRSALDLYQQTNDVKYKAAAFGLAESNKALLLLESINDQSAKGFSGIPDSLLEKEKDIKLQLAFLQRTLLNDKANQKSIKNTEDLIFDLNQQLDRLTTHFEKNYPRYFDLKYQNDPIDLESIQAKLATSNTALLEYFVGEEVIYVFVVSPNSLDINIIDDPKKVFKSIQQLRSILNNSPAADALSDFLQFTSAAHSLHILLVESALIQIPESIKSLTIIPDDQINYVPFSILLTEDANQNKPSYSALELEYLMKAYSINYHYSATLLYKSQLRNQKTFDHNFIGFAPSFKEANATNISRSCTSDELYSLKCSSEEVAAISKLLNGVTKSGIQASKSTFEKEAAAYRIIHLATHACVDENNSNLNKIFLTDDFLSNYDLYNMNLDAELAVLSACNTGSGELIKGEGVMNLARGFINAGCSSTLMSMWSVDDCATSDIMLSFYKALKKGLKKDEALRMAKLNYLEQVSKTKRHPYYWAAFVPFGDMGTMEIGNQSNSLWYLLAIIIALLLLGLFIKRKSFLNA